MPVHYNSRYPVDRGGGYKVNREHYFSRGLMFWYPGAGLPHHVTVNGNGQYMLRDAGPYGFDILSEGATSLSPRFETTPFGSVAYGVTSSGDSGFILPDISADLTASTEATLSIWLKNDSGNSYFCWSGASENIDSHYPFTGNDLYFSNFLTARIGPLANTAFGDAGRESWHHLCITSTPGTNNWKLYQNGILRHTSTGDSVPEWSGNVLLGKARRAATPGDASGSAYVGNFFFPAVHKRALSAREVYGLWDPATRWSMFEQQNHVVYLRPAALGEVSTESLATSTVDADLSLSSPAAKFYNIAM